MKLMNEIMNLLVSRIKMHNHLSTSDFVPSGQIKYNKSFICFQLKSNIDATLVWLIKNS